MPMAYLEFSGELDLTMAGVSKVFDVRGYGVGAFAVTVPLGVWSSSTVIFEGSVDQQAWVAFDPALSFTADAVELVGGQNLLFPFVRARVSVPNAGGGTARASVYVREA